MVTGVCAVALAMGYHLRDEMYLSPDAGLGYGLGVAGLAAMSALLLYSLRKRARVLWSLGPLRHWFHVHMLLGVLGPVMILFHANFEVRSMNAAVALVAMLIVAGSGFIGRFAYARVHTGLFGQRETLRDVMARANESRSALHRALGAVPSVAECVAEFEAQVLEPPRNAFAELWR
ncbi:MAG: pyridine nucleotide-disulfide oxidoreductase, partial [Solirubrobacteraceae bacterium]